MNNCLFFYVLFYLIVYRLLCILSFLKFFLNIVLNNFECKIFFDDLFKIIFRGSIKIWIFVFGFFYVLEFWKFFGKLIVCKLKEFGCKGLFRVYF